jgi:2,3-bisphosphoglycerate-dependent phosphoglycerate mutase
VRGGRCTVLGYIIVDHSENPNWVPHGKYPKIGYQLFFRMEIEEVLPYQCAYESTQRVFVDPAQVAGLNPGHGLTPLMLKEAEGIRYIYLVRHCKAEGQPPESPLTSEGVAQTVQLAEKLARTGVQQIVSSPYVRAVESIRPFAVRLGLPVQTDPRLAERVLSSSHLPKWADALRDSFTDLDLRFEGGETSREAMSRAAAVVTDVLQSPLTTTVLVSHGNLIALLLKQFDPEVGFAHWQALSNPDLHLLTIRGSHCQIERIWV